VTYSMGKGIITVGKIEVREDVVTFGISPEGPVGEFILKDSLFVKADHPLGAVPLEILVIPLLGCLVPLSWVTNSEIIAEGVDMAFLACVPKVQGIIRRAYPGLLLQGDLRARPVRTRGTWNPERYCLLYSGGVDSLTSFIRNRDKKPDLLMVRGTPDMRLDDSESFNRSIERITPRLDEIGARLHILETNALDALDYQALQRSVKSNEIHGWWENFAHGMFLLGACAPFTYYNCVGKLMISSSDTARLAAPWGSMPESDQQVSWGGLEVIHDSYDYTKFEKISRVLVPFISDRKWAGFPVKVCTGKPAVRVASGKLNCGRCGKCIRTMLMLLENGVDPGECEFEMRRFSPHDIRIGLENGYIKIAEAPEAWGFVLDNACNIPPRLESKYKGTTALMTWMTKWNRTPEESILRTYSKEMAPVGSRRRHLAKKILRRD